MGVIVAFGVAEEGAPSYEQFSHLYSITKSKSADHGGKLKQPRPTQSEIQQIDRVRLKAPAAERVYPKFLFTENLIKAHLVNPVDMIDARKAAEAKRMNESPKRRLMMGLQGKKAKRQAETVLIPSAGVDPKNQTLANRLRQLNAEPVPSKAAEVVETSGRGQAFEAGASKAAGKRPFMVDLDAEPVPKRAWQTEPPRAIFAAQDDYSPAEPISITCRRRSSLRTT
ncbi:hypothetical protein GBA52_020286 [Prunus armeniaca]|nr:hypothetical protein GBA52_020286 [Prunus armeniaca]